MKQGFWANDSRNSLLCYSYEPESVISAVSQAHIKKKKNDILFSRLYLPPSSFSTTLCCHVTVQQSQIALTTYCFQTHFFVSGPCASSLSLTADEVSSGCFDTLRVDSAPSWDPLQTVRHRAFTRELWSREPKVRRTFIVE